MRKALENYDGLRPSGCPCAAQGSESKGVFSFAKENTPFDSLPCAAQGHPDGLRPS